MKNVLSILEKNYKTLQALQQLQNGSSGSTNAEMDISGLGDFKEDQSMDMDDGTDDEMEVEDGDADGEASEFKQKVLAVLKERNYSEKRSSKLSQEEFLHLLSQTSVQYGWHTLLLIGGSGVTLFHFKFNPILFAVCLATKNLIYGVLSYG